MTLTELNSLDPLVQKYRALGWQFFRYLIPEGDNGTHHSYEIKSPRMSGFASIYYCFDETQLNSFECLSVARQNHEKAITVALFDVKEDMIKEVAAIYSLVGKGAQVPSEIVVKELRIPLFPAPESSTTVSTAT